MIALLPLASTIVLPFRVDPVSGAVTVEGTRNGRPIRVMIALGQSVTRTRSTDAFELGNRSVDLSGAVIAPLPDGVDVALAEDRLRGALGRDEEASRYTWWPDVPNADALKTWVGTDAVALPTTVREDGTVSISGKIGTTATEFVIGSGLSRCTFRPASTKNVWRRLLSVAGTDLDGVSSVDDVGLVGPISIGSVRVPTVIAALGAGPSDVLDVRELRTSRIAVPLSGGSAFVRPVPPQSFGARIVSDLLGTPIGSTSDAWTLAEYPKGFPPEYRTEFEGRPIEAIAGLSTSRLRAAFRDAKEELDLLGQLGLRAVPPYGIDVATKSGPIRRLNVQG